MPNLTVLQVFGVVIGLIVPSFISISMPPRFSARVIALPLLYKSPWLSLLDPPPTAT
jgi:hypothetical protein